MPEGKNAVWWLLQQRTGLTLEGTKKDAVHHYIRIIYEYEGTLPLIVTVYYPHAQRYFDGGKIYEDRILA